MSLINPFPASDDYHHIDGIISVYQKSFGDYPWNEGYKCVTCDAYYPLSTSEKFCIKCLQNHQTSALVEYWPKEKVLADFNTEMRRPGAICVAEYKATSSLRRGEDIIAFAWGYDITMNPETDEHLDAPGLSDLVSGTFFYLDECAVTPEYQGQGLGKVLVNEIFTEQPHDQILLRTLNDSRMCKLILHLGGEIIQHISPGSRDYEVESPLNKNPTSLM